MEPVSRLAVMRSGRGGMPLVCRVAGWPKPFSLLLRPLEWKAGRITDPAEKLRYLRRTIGTAEAVRPWVAKGAGAVALVALLGYISVTLRGSASKVKEPDFPGVVSASAGMAAVPRVWLVDQKDDYEVYSNGLRIETKGAAKHSPRLYLPLDRKHPETWNGNGAPATAWLRQPVGIVFHTTESDLVPYSPEQNANLKRLSQDIVAYVRRNKSYHYLVDRFGRVHRIVEEDSIANHAGNSVWGDRQSIYVNLNSSFLGVSFEAQTRPHDGGEVLSQAQMHAGRVLTDMLRYKYGLDPEKCVTHAQVSVNPDNFRIGAHTDWAVRFPFGEMGLPDNYSLPVASMTAFGFNYDNSFVTASEARLWKGLLIAQEEVRQAAGAQGATLPSYRAALHRKYKEIVEARKAPPKDI